MPNPYKDAEREFQLAEFGMYARATQRNAARLDEVVNLRRWWPL